MATGRRTDPPDLDFDDPPGAPAALPERWGESRTDYLRLVVNPFLALGSAILLVAGSIVAVRLGARPVVVLAFSALVFTPRLVQFHCLDCGLTARYRRWKGHACRHALERAVAGRRRRFRTPSPPLQLAIWAYLIAMAGVVLALGRGPGR